MQTWLSPRARTGPGPWEERSCLELMTRSSADAGRGERRRKATTEAQRHREIRAPSASARVFVEIAHVRTNTRALALGVRIARDRGRIVMVHPPADIETPERGDCTCQRSRCDRDRRW